MNDFQLDYFAYNFSIRMLYNLIIFSDSPLYRCINILIRFYVQAKIRARVLKLFGIHEYKAFFTQSFLWTHGFLTKAHPLAQGFLTEAQSCAQGFLNKFILRVFTRDGAEVQGCAVVSYRWAGKPVDCC